MTLEELVQTVFEDIWEKDNGEVFVSCCFCDDEKHRLGINVETGVMHCFNCEEKSGDRDSVFRSKEKTFKKIAETTYITEKFTVEEGEKDIVAKNKKKQYAKELPKSYEPLWKEVNDRDGRKALRYVLSRGVTKEQIKHHRIGFCAAGRYAYRIVMPVLYRKSLQGFVCRDYSGTAELKYLNSDGEKGLYNAPRVSRRKDNAILSEGPFDVLAIERANIKEYDVIGCLGSKLKKSQIKQLSTYKQIIIWAEPDSAGVEGTIQRARALQKKGVQVYIVMPDSDIESDTDPGAMQPNEIKQRVKSKVLYTSGIAALMRARIAFSSRRILPRSKK